ncbi:hypothetical protein Syun_023150 [Stephania yunnanensis]|uniref:Uncharacterized protein n=1 Tax=Stephania yunnanensis TaxID=152371 RepID=A0AAP0FN01_9MAGN
MSLRIHNMGKTTSEAHNRKVPAKANTCKLTTQSLTRQDAGTTGIITPLEDGGQNLDDAITCVVERTIETSILDRRLTCGFVHSPLTLRMGVIQNPNSEFAQDRPCKSLHTNHEGEDRDEANLETSVAKEEARTTGEGIPDFGLDDTSVGSGEDYTIALGVKGDEDE